MNWTGTKTNPTRTEQPPILLPAGKIVFPSHNAQEFSAFESASNRQQAIPVSFSRSIFNLQFEKILIQPQELAAADELHGVSADSLSYDNLVSLTQMPNCED
jgi:hypothetical protein